MKTKEIVLYKLESNLPLAGVNQIYSKKEWKRIYGYDVGMVVGAHWIKQ